MIAVSADRNAPYGKNNHYSADVSKEIYVLMSKLLMLSLEHKCPWMPVAFNAMNFTDQDMEDLKFYNSSIQFYRRSIDFDGRSRNWYKGKVCSACIPFMSELLNQGNTFVFMGIDCLVRNPIFELFTQANKCDIMVHTRFSSRTENNKFQDGVLVIRPTKNSKRFIELWRELCQDYGMEEMWIPDKRGNVHGDQYLFYKAYQKMKKTLNIIHLPAEYNDGALRPTSFIWHANKGFKHERLQEFVDDFACMHKGPRTVVLVEECRSFLARIKEGENFWRKPRV